MNQSPAGWSNPAAGRFHVSPRTRLTSTGGFRYDRGCGKNCRDVISRSGFVTIRVQLLPEQ